MKQLPEAAQREAFETLYRTHHGAVERYVRRRCRADQAGDVVAETFTIAWRKLEDALRGGLPWLYRTAYLALRNHQRAELRQNDTATLLAGLAESGASDPHEAHAARCQLVTAMRTLSVRDRELLFLTYWEQLSLRQAATIIGCSAATAGVRVHRARRRLNHALNQPPGEEPRPNTTLRTTVSEVPK